jgi:hypothetical protein
MRNRSSLIALAVAAACFVIFGAFVWPTIWRYDHIHESGGTRPVRINRFTGRTEILYSTGWTEARPLTPEQLREYEKLLR